MDQRTESIKQELDATREALTAKLEQLESQAPDLVKASTQATLKRAWSHVIRMVNERPWAMLGAAVTLGFGFGIITGRSERLDFTPSARARPAVQVQTFKQSLTPLLTKVLELIIRAIVAYLASEFKRGRQAREHNYRAGTAL